MTLLKGDAFVARGVFFDIVDPHGYLAGVDPGKRYRFEMLLMVLVGFGFGNIRVSSGRRTIYEQEVLYGYGRTRAQLQVHGMNPALARPDRMVVTWVLPGASAHVIGAAIDLSLADYGESAFKQLGRAAKLCGLTWGGDWKVRDYGHFEC